MRKHYWGIRPKTIPDHVRIEQAETPLQAARLAFGRGTTRFQFKDFGTRLSVIQSDKQRIALCKTESGWTDFG